MTSDMLLASMLTKRAYEIKPSDRPSIPKKDFAQPGKEEAGHKGKYPIPDRQHAKSALGFAKMHHDSGALAAVKKKVEAKYPDMLKKESVAKVESWARDLAREDAALTKQAVRNFKKVATLQDALNKAKPYIQKGLGAAAGLSQGKAALIGAGKGAATSLVRHAVRSPEERKKHNLPLSVAGHALGGAVIGSAVPTFAKAMQSK